MTTDLGLKTQTQSLQKNSFSSIATFLFCVFILLGWADPSFSQVAKNYQHWADVTVANWNGDILNDSKSDYFEGQVIPHVHVIQGTNKKPLLAGVDYTFTIIYNFYQANTNAGGFAYATTYNRSRNPGLLPGASNVPPIYDNTATPGLNVAGGQGYFYRSKNVDVISASAPVQSGSGTFDNTVTVKFRYTGTNPLDLVEFYYGLYISEPTNLINGASSWSGGSLQTTVNSDFSGALSIQLAPAAIIRGEISGIKYGDTNNSGSRQTGEAPLSGWTIYLDLNNNGTRDLFNGVLEPIDVTEPITGFFSFSVTPDADKTDADNDPYFVRELQNQTGWTLTQPASGVYGPITISAADPTETGLIFGNFICVKPTASEVHTDVSCNGGTTGTATISATGGTGLYTFAKGTGAYQSSGIFENLAAGTYTFHAKDANQCVGDVTVVIGQPAVLVASEVHTDVSCNGGSTGTATISSSGGKGTVTFAKGAGSYQASGLFENLAAGTYTFYAKDGSGCIDDVTVIVGQPAVLVASEVHTDVSCNGGSTGTATISSSGGKGTVTFAKGAESYQASGLFKNLVAGTYTFYAKDGSGCIDDVTVIITEPTALTAIADATTLCTDVGVLSISLTIKPSGGVGPYKITSVSTGIDGSYKYTVTDANDCGCPVTSTLKTTSVDNSKLLSPADLNIPAIISSTEAIKVETVSKSPSLMMDKLAVNVYPNPFTDEVNFKFKSPASGFATLEIFDLSGRKVAVVFKGIVEANSEQAAKFSVPAYSSRNMLVYRLSVGSKLVSGKILPQ